VRVIERPFSDLLRHPKDVTTDVEDNDVLLRRRDEPDLRLTLARREAERADAVVSLGHALRSLAVHSPDELGAALIDTFSWLEFLPRHDRQTFVEEFSRTLVASAEVDNFAAVGQLLREWRATAEVHSDPELARRLEAPVEASGAPVAPPAA
jgi:hypothetical protein